MRYFDVFHKDLHVSRVWFDFRTEQVTFENYVNDILWCPFGKKTSATFGDLETFWEERCFPRTRVNAKEVLRLLGVDYYDPYDIVRKTHGVQNEDFCWLRFDDEEGMITYADVKFRD